MSRRFHSDDFSWNMKHGFRWASSMIRSSTSFKHSSWLQWNPPTAWMPLFSKSLSINASLSAVKFRRISSLDQNEKVLEDHENKNQLIMDNLNNKHYLVLRELLRLLEHGLKERLYLICPLPVSDHTRNTVSSSFMAKGMDWGSVRFSGQSMKRCQREVLRRLVYSSRISMIWPSWRDLKMQPKK